METSLSSDMLDRIEAICTTFESLCQNAKSPSIEEHLGNCEEPQRSALLQQLVGIEVHYRHQQGQPVSEESYRTRFPGDAQAISEVFERYAPPPTPHEVQTLPVSTSTAATQRVTFEDVSVPGYDILSEIARGGMGVVYKARHQALDCLVALKVVLTGQHASEEERQRMLREAQAIATLQHTNIIHVFDVGENQGQPYLALELCSPHTLADRISEHPLPPKEAANITETLARAMQVAHEHGIIHRDLKPSNVLLTDEGTLKITDFGLAKRLDEGEGLTRTNVVMGTPSYAPPEQVQGLNQKIDARADVYALGAILYELLTGQPPFRAATTLDTILQVISDEPVPVRQLNSQVPVDLETICLKALEKEPGKRYQSAVQLAEELKRFQNGESIQARPISRVAKAWRWCKRYPAVAGLVAMVIILLVGGTTISSFFAVTARVSARAKAQLAEKEGLARKAAERQKKEAENAQRIAEAKEKEAEKLAKELSESLARSERRQSRICLMLAKRRYQEGSLGGAREMLEACLQKHRGWEWYHIHRLCYPCAQTLARYKNNVLCIDVHPDGKSVASGSRDGIISISSTATGKSLHVWRSHHGSVNDLVYSPNGDRLISVGQDGTAKIWNTRTGKLISSRKLHNGRPINCICIFLGNKLIVTGGVDKLAIIWSVDQWKELHRHEHRNAVYDVAISNDGRWFASADQHGNGTLSEVTDEDGKMTVFRTKSHPQLCFKPDNKVLAVAAHNLIHFFDVRTGKEFGLHQGDRWFFSIDWAPDGTKIVGGKSDGTIDTFQANNTKSQHAELPVLSIEETYHGHFDIVNRVIFTSDSRRFASGSHDGTVQLWPHPVPAARKLPEVRHRLPSFNHRNVSNIAIHPGPPQEWWTLR